MKELKLTGAELSSMMPLRPRLVCKDGFSFSAQASADHYCSPRKNWAELYTAVEVGFPSAHEELFEPFFDTYGDENRKMTDEVMGWVDTEVVLAVIEKHGGLDPAAMKPVK